MTVSELIAELQKCDPAHRVCVMDDEGFSSYARRVISYNEWEEVCIE